MRKRVEKYLARGILCGLQVAEAVAAEAINAR
jgi:hypothetical protein